ncbi:heterokaryon incompatibility protein [Colletotrichum musicola]|uniref:Heterokaryon incompatibility protein n=1 Tax=Colletotrichum musicola TaxID=2175873 RepID=A0A8H6KGQ1_9PEZI|nr:heterokaryon incompatibility protein [Colletotrichum musicola]
MATETEASGLYARRLCPGKREIRLLEIEDNVQVSCNLHIVSLDDDPYFIALSYVWGDPSVTEEIVLDGVKTAVTTNLSSALKHVKKHWTEINAASGRPREAGQFRIWADAVCINQQDGTEKSQQVALMRDIYTSADSVFAWLSPEDGDTSHALETLGKIFEIVDAYVDTKTGRPAEVEGPDWVDVTYDIVKTAEWVPLAVAVLRWALHLDLEQGAIFAPGDSWTALLHLSELPFWYRVWILQELALARSLHYMCPSARISHGRGVLAVTCVMETLKLLRRQRAPELTGLIHSRVAVLQAKLNLVHRLMFLRQSFHRELAIGSSCGGTLGMVLFTLFTGNIRATNPRDFVYGVLGLADFDVAPDYSAPVREVYVRSARVFVEEWRRVSKSPEKTFGCLIFLQHCAAGLRNSEGLPTWAPSFDLRPRHWRMNTRAGECRAFRDVVDLRDAPEVAISGTTLRVPALEAQAITYLYDRPIDDDFFGTGLLPCCETFLALLGPKYVNGKPLLVALCCTLIQKLDCQYELRRLASLFLGLCRWQPSGVLYEELEESMRGLEDMGMWDDMEFMLGQWMPAVSNNWGSRLVATRDGYMGLAGGDVQAGDVVCVLMECDGPVVLRQEDDHYLFVSPCFMMGLMEGEVSKMIDSGAEVRVIDIH